MYLPTPFDFKTLPLDLRNFLALEQHHRLLWKKMLHANSSDRESVNIWWHARRRGPRTLSKTTDANLGYVFVKTRFFALILDC